MPSDRFSAEQDDTLIELVFGHPMLWNMANNEWKNQFKKDLVWAEVGRKLEKTSSQCKLRWKSIRDHYRNQRKQEKGMPTGSAAAKKRATYWDRLQFLETVDDERCTFTNANMQETETPAPAVDLDDPDSQQLDNSSQPLLQCSDAAMPPFPQQTLPASSPLEDSETFRKPPRQKKQITKQKSVLKELVTERRHDREHLQACFGQLLEQESEDENDLFFKTMARTVKKFRPALITQAKKKIFALVMALEEENQQTPNNCRGNFSPINYPGIGYCNESSSSPSSSVHSTPFQQYSIDEPENNVISEALKIALSQSGNE